MSIFTCSPAGCRGFSLSPRRRIACCALSAVHRVFTPHSKSTAAMETARRTTAQSPGAAAGGRRWPQRPRSTHDLTAEQRTHTDWKRKKPLLPGCPTKCIYRSFSGGSFTRSDVSLKGAVSKWMLPGQLESINPKSM